MRRLGALAARASPVSGVLIARGTDRRARRAVRVASRELKARYAKLLTTIEALEPGLELLGMEQLCSRFTRTSEQLRHAGADAVGDAGSGDPLAEAFAVVREAARRLLGLRPFHSQLLAGLALYEGHVAELPTGEGKTLAAACLPRAFTQQLAGGCTS